MVASKQDIGLGNSHTGALRCARPIGLVVALALSASWSNCLAQPARSASLHPAVHADDSVIAALRARYLGKNFEAADTALEASGWKAIDGDSGYTIFQKGELKVEIDYQPGGGVHATGGPISNISRVH